MPVLPVAALQLLGDVQQWIRDLPSKTGRPLEGWMSLVKRQKLGSEALARDWLKREHGMGTNTAWWIVERAFAKDLSLMDDDPVLFATRDMVSWGCAVATGVCVVLAV